MLYVEFLTITRCTEWNRTRLFDHWAHLSGALFGVVYYYFGPSFWHEGRMLLVGNQGQDQEKKERDDKDSE